MTMLRVAWAVIAVIAVGTAIGMVVLWPSGGGPDLERDAVSRLATEKATVIGATSTECEVPDAADCRRVSIRIETGPDKGARASFSTGDSGGRIDLDAGDEIRVVKNDVPEDVVGRGVEIDPYSFSDFERRSPMTWLAIAFVTIVLIAGRLRGLRSLIGLIASLGVVVFFVVPAILEGTPPLAVAVAGSFAIMLITIALAHGVGPKSVAAALGTASSLLLTIGIALLFVELSHLSGFSSEEAIYLQASQSDLSLVGLVLAGMVIGALGVLDDVTVSQSSTVMALRRANPAMGFARLFREGIAVGRDHIAATVNTLVLAYAGASLPVLLVFSVGDTPFGDAVNLEVVAEQVVSTLVGSIGLIAAVPITTGLAAALAARMPADAVGNEPLHQH